MTGAKILLVEDESIEAMDIRRTLESLGYTVPYVASRGEEAVEKASEIRPDLILMDIVLKGQTNGIEAAKKIKEINIPLIFLTAHSEESTIEKAKLTEPYGYLIKPYDATELKYAIELAIYKNKMEKELKDSEEKYRRLTENSQDVIYQMSLPDGQYQYVNPAAEKLFETPLDIFYKKPGFIWDLIHPDFHEYFRKNLEKLLKGDVSPFYEYKIITKSGKEKWLNQRNTLITNEKGNPIAIQGIITDVTYNKNLEEALKERERELKLKLDNILSPDYKVEEEDLKNIINTQEIQSLMNHFFALTKIGIAILDLEGNVLVATGWQDICTKFHRVNQHSCKNCLESDLYLTQDLKPGEYRIYKCKNNMWDMVTPIMLGENHAGNLFLGQFFFEDEKIDYELFEAQADKFGFDKEKYLAALEQVPRWSRKKVETVMQFYSEFAQMISKMSYSNLKLAKSLHDLKVTEKARKKSEQNYRNLVDNSLVGIFKTNLQGEILFANEAIARIFHYPNVEELKQQNIINFYKNPDDRLELIHLLEKKGNITNYELEALSKTGRTVHLMGSVKLEGNVLSGMFMDITARKKAEKAMLQSERKYKTLFESNPVYTIITSEDGEVLDYNKTAEQIIGKPKVELVGKHFSKLDIFPEEDLALHKEKFLHLVKYKTVDPYESRIFDKNGNIRWGETSLTIIKEDKDSNYILVIFNDITERKKADNKIIKSLEEKEVLLREIHHRVKNNMQIISSLLNLQIHFEDSEKTVRVLKESQGRVKSMAMIHEKLYQSPSLTSINFKEYVEKLVHEIFYSYGIKKTSIKPVLDIEDINLNIETAIPLGLIINELVTNSVKYAFPKDEGTIKIQLKKLPEYSVLSIADNGIGLPKDFDIKNTKTIGLQLINSLIKQLDGEIELNLENGTEFKITFKEVSYKKRL